jgi:hypothetical protein
MRQYFDLRDRSLVRRFEAMEQAFTKRERFGTAEVRPPSPAIILNHLRLSPSADQWPTGLDAAAETLVAEEGLEEAFLRLSTLPVSLPQALISAFLRLEPTHRSVWVQAGVKTFRTPVMRLHLARLLLGGSADDANVAVDMLCEIAGDEGSEGFDAFAPIFSWTYRELIARDEADAPDFAILLSSWIYAARLHQFLAGRVDQGELIRAFAAGARPRPRELMRPHHAIWLDAAGPQLVSHTTFAVHGIALCLRDISSVGSNGRSSVKR